MWKILFEKHEDYKDHKKYLAEREFEALKERVAGTNEGEKGSRDFQWPIKLDSCSSDLEIFNGRLNSTHF
ncbi:hypothetical protein HanRHA438_Chr10g0476621 [Helianthus annuus]|nr:hypothetical protein HanRHA438_Chr10g0476621 [Helianthus annuus]